MARIREPKFIKAPCVNVKLPPVNVYPLGGATTAVPSGISPAIPKAAGFIAAPVLYRLG
jgi:hypothetical protein